MSTMLRHMSDLAIAVATVSSHAACMSNIVAGAWGLYSDCLSCAVAAPTGSTGTVAHGNDRRLILHRRLLMVIRETHIG
jgi:hypothetical protein